MIPINKRKDPTFFSLHGMKITDPSQPSQPSIPEAKITKTVVRTKPRKKLVKKKKEPRINRSFKTSNPGNCKERGNAYYDQQYIKSKIYEKLPYNIEGNYLHIWTGGVNLCKQKKIPYVVDLGCGPGHFAKLLQDNHPNLLKYWGYDFSTVSLRMGTQMVKRDSKFAFRKADILNFDFTDGKPSNILYTAYEFLEHINNDIGVIKKLPGNTLFSFSVPNYWSPGHVRIFQEEKDVRERYGSFFSELHIKEFQFVKKDTPLIIQFFCFGKTIEKPEDTVFIEPDPPTEKLSFGLTSQRTRSQIMYYDGFHL
jgi:SAM-dependent methyltransferase